VAPFLPIAATAMSLCTTTVPLRIMALGRFVARLGSKLIFPLKTLFRIFFRRFLKGKKRGFEKRMDFFFSSLNPQEYKQLIFSFLREDYEKKGFFVWFGIFLWFHK